MVGIGWKTSKQTALAQPAELFFRFSFSIDNTPQINYLSRTTFPFTFTLESFFFLCVLLAHRFRISFSFSFPLLFSRLSLLFWRLVTSGKKGRGRRVWRAREKLRILFFWKTSFDRKKTHSLSAHKTSSLHFDTTRIFHRSVWSICVRWPPHRCCLHVDVVVSHPLISLLLSLALHAITFDVVTVPPGVDDALLLFVFTTQTLPIEEKLIFFLSRSVAVITTASESFKTVPLLLLFECCKFLFANDVNFSEPRLRPNFGKMLFSTWSWALRSLPRAHRHAFMKDFLKLSL